MRKQLIAGTTVAAVIIIAAVGGTIAVRHNHQVQSQQKVAAAAHAKALADWQQKVKAWNAQQVQKQQVAVTTQESDLQQQGVAELPNTGAGNMLVVGLVGGMLATAGYQFVLRRSVR